MGTLILREHFEVKPCIQELVDVYGFQLQFDGSDRFSLVTDKVRIEFYISDPRYREVSHKVFDSSCNPPKQYLHLYMLACRVPQVLVERGSYAERNEPTSLEDEMKESICGMVNDLIKWFPDVLRGDFAVLQSRDKYDELVEDSERLSIGVLAKLDYNDPITKKFFASDFSWIQDLKARLAFELSSGRRFQSY